jgi:hypothetical protein
LEALAVVNTETEVARDAVRELFYALPVFRWCSRHAQPPRTRYVRSPGALAADFVRLQERWAADPPLAAPHPEMVYAFLARELSFEVFRRSMPQIQRLDRELGELFGRSADALCDDLFPVAPGPPGRWDKNQWLRDRVRRLTARPEFFERLRFAAAESAPIRKLREFGRAFAMVRKDFIENFPPSKDLGEDELLPAQIACVIVANPPALASNLAFICEFCAAPNYDRLFLQNLIQPLSVLRMVCRYLSDSQMLVDMGYLPAPGPPF